MSTAHVYRRALWRFATSILLTILNVVVCTRMIHWVSQRDVSPLILVLTAPLALTLWNMWRYAAAPISSWRGKISIPSTCLNVPLMGTSRRSARLYI